MARRSLRPCARRQRVNGDFSITRAIGEAIDKARDQLGLPPYALHQELVASRGPVGPEAVGEPKQAQAWLDRLAEAKAAQL
jgi:hypothetical protein